MKIKPNIIIIPNHLWQFVSYAVDFAYFETVGHQGMCTSGADGDHSENSFHYRQGRAWDFRIYRNNTPREGKYEKETLENLRANMKARLGSLFQVVIEKDHIHVEFDQPNKPSFFQ